MLYESAESMARLGGVNPSEVIEHLNGLNPQCPVQLQTLRFRPWRQPPLSPCEASDATAASLAAAASAAPNSEDEGDNQEVEELERVKSLTVLRVGYLSLIHI